MQTTTQNDSQQVTQSGLSVTVGSGLRVVRRYESWPVSGPATYNKGWRYYIQCFRRRWGFFGALDWHDEAGPFNDMTAAQAWMDDRADDRQLGTEEVCDPNNSGQTAATSAAK